ncbi:MAG: hypothetical protein BGO55_31635 [Sphingobacteriales bacterium 50-39]|nr:MAG: hypothetical protein BGO55_31635 [Sphingobacteriales bacterium 50-39]
MENFNERIRYLIMQHLKGESTIHEQLELQEWVNASNDHRELFDQFSDPERLKEELKEYFEAQTNIWDKIDAGIKTPAYIEGPAESVTRTIHPIRHHIRSYVAAASLLLIIITGYFWLRPRHTPIEGRSASVPVAARDVAPGGDKAILTLANGATIVLDNAQNGAIAQQGATSITQLTGGQLTYNTPAKAASVGYNTISTPLGGQYKVTLPDQSKVWLNSGSSLRFPTAFTSTVREVSITGEAYFEVADNKSMPFHVKVNDMDVTVLGTHFNIMAYQDEDLVKTTLLQGAVRVNRENQSVMLTPGQQAQAGKGLRVISDANTEEAVAWKEGLFEFNSAGIEMVMRTLARWYNVDIRYEGSKTGNRLTGKIRRDSNLSDVLQILSTSGYHFKIEGKTILVLP